MSVAGGAAEKVPRNNLKETERRSLIDELLEGSTNGKLVKGDLKRCAEMFGCSVAQVSRVWHRYKQQKDAGASAVNLRNNRAGKSGRKGIDVEALRGKLVQIPLKNRTTQRSVAAQLGIPRTTLMNNLKKLGMHASSRFLKPLPRNEFLATQWTARDLGTKRHVARHPRQEPAPHNKILEMEEKMAAVERESTTNRNMYDNMKKVNRNMKETLESYQQQLKEKEEELVMIQGRISELEKGHSSQKP